MSVTIVPNLKALASLNPGDGDTCYVQTLRSTFICDMSGLSSPDGITIVQPGLALENVPPGPPWPFKPPVRWVRLPTAHPSWLRQATWFISSHGNDENEGNTASKALRTHAELSRRWGAGSPTLLGSVSRTRANPNPISFIRVKLMDNLAPTDPLHIDVTLGPNTALLYEGTPTESLVGTTTGSLVGTLSNVTKKNPAKNTPWSVRGNTRAIGDGDLGKRLRITKCNHGPDGQVVLEGVHLGQFAWIAKPHLDGGSNARMSSFAKPAASWDVPSPVDALKGAGLKSGEVAEGDEFVVEDLTEVTVRSICVDGPQAAEPFAPVIAFRDIAFRHAGPAGLDSASRKLQTQGGVRGIKAVLMGCSWDGTLALSSDITRHWYLNCRFHHLALTRVGAVFLAGLCLGEVSYRGGMANFDDDFMVQGSIIGSVGFRVQASGALFGSVCSFDSKGHGFHIGLDSAVPCSSACFNLGSKPYLLWGKGNAKYGVYVASGSVLAYQAKATVSFPLVVTGEQGDFALAGSTENTRAFHDGAGLPRKKPITPTWANLERAIAIDPESNDSGFGGNAHDFARDAHIVGREPPPQV